MPQVVCQNTTCKKEFYAKISSNRKYCCQRCYIAAKSEMRTIRIFCHNPVCRKEFQILTFENSRKYCCRACYCAMKRKEYDEISCANPECLQTLNKDQIQRRTMYCCRECLFNHKASSYMERFWCYIEKTSSCWIWKGPVDQDGYGLFWYGRPSRKIPSHKFSYELIHGNLPENEYLHHSCENIICCNPEHLYTLDTCEKVSAICANAVCNTHFTTTKHAIRTSKNVFCCAHCRDTYVRPLEERFWENVHKTQTCWEWNGKISKQGYGLFYNNHIFYFNKTGWVFAHRIAYQLEYGFVFPGIFMCHKCDNPPCVRPSHIFLGTRGDNMRDMRDKGRSWYARYQALKALQQE